MNKNFLRFAALFIYKDRKKHALTFFLFSFLVAILFSLVFISSSIKTTLEGSLKNAPDIRVVPQKNGYDFFADTSYIDKLSRIRGVSSIEGRVFGRYFFPQGDTYFYVAGVDFFKENKEDFIKNIADHTDINDLLKDDFIVVGSRVQNKLQAFHYDKHFNFFLPKGGVLKLNIVDVLKPSPINENVIVTGIINARKILGLKEDEYSDIGLYVPNESELPNIVTQIRDSFPGAKVVLKKDAGSYYSYLFDYKGGVFLIFYIVVLLSFFILLYQRISAILSGEKREIAILKATGWSIGDIIRFKALINFTLSFFAFCFGLFVAYLYVYKLGAPGLIRIFLQHTQEAVLRPYFSFSLIYTVFIFTVVPYMAATIIPSWKASVIDVEEVLR